MTAGDDRKTASAIRPKPGRARPLAVLTELPGIGGELVSAGFWSLILRGVGMVATFVLGVQLARYLGPSQLGIYGLVVAIAMLLSSFGQLGLPTLATREVAVAMARGDHAGLRGIFRWFGLFVGLVSAALGLGFALAVLLWPGGASVYKGSIIWGAMLVPLFALTVLVSAELRALGRLVLGQSLEILARPLLNCLALLALFLALGSIDATQALAINVAASILALLLGGYWLARSIPAEAKSARPATDIAKWSKSAAPLAVTDVLRQLDGVYPLLMVGALASNYEAGIFRVAQSTVLVIAIPLFIVQVIVAPTLARLHDAGDKAALQRLVRFSARINFVAALIMAAIVAIGGQQLLGLFFGDEYRSAWLPLMILCAGQVISGFFGIGFVLLPMAGAERQLTVSFAGSVSAGLAAAIPLVATFGASGAALAAVIGTLTNGAVAAYYSNSRLGVRITAVGKF